MAFLRDITMLRKVEWSKSYLWDVLLDGSNNGSPSPPAPFDDWFPAVDITENSANLDSHIQEAYMTILKFPLKSNTRSINLTFVDDINNTLYNYFKTWINRDILNLNSRNFHVSVLEDAARIIHIQKLGADRQLLTGQLTSYLVYPEGSLNFTGSSESTLHTYQVELVVVGEIPNSSSVQATGAG